MSATVLLIAPQKDDHTRVGQALAGIRGAPFRLETVGTLADGLARFLDPHRVQVVNDQHDYVLTADYVLIAGHNGGTGASPAQRVQGRALRRHQLQRDPGIIDGKRTLRP